MKQFIPASRVGDRRSNSEMNSQRWYNSDYTESTPPAAQNPLTSHSPFAGRFSQSCNISEVTRILNAMEAGNPGGAEELLPLVFDEFRRLAVTQMACEKPGQTLQPTALVHDPSQGRRI